jgi:hypothetical protein
MKLTLQFNRPNTFQLNFTALVAFFVKLVSRLTHLTGPANDPAALRYVANKYDGKGD